MSQELTEFAKSFAAGEVPAARFSDEFIDRWKQEGNDGRLLLDAPNESEVLSSIFCMADLYNPKPSRRDYEFDEETLRAKVKALLSQIATLHT